MNAINYYSEYERSGDFLTEASLSSKGFDIRVEHAQWSKAGTARIQTHGSNLIRLILRQAHVGGEPARNLGSFTGFASRQLKPLGELLFIPHGTEFHLKHDACEQKALVCLFNPAALEPLASYDWKWACASEGMLNLQSAYLQASLQRLAEEVSCPGFASDLHTECLLTSIALELRRGFRNTRVEEDRTGKLSPRQLKLLRELLEAGPEEAASLQQLAAVCAMPARKLSSHFKNTTGKTLRQYAAEARVRKAKALLADPQLLVKQVAYQAGFQNAAAFTAAFRKTVGVTPEEFRRQRG